MTFVLATDLLHTLVRWHNAEPHLTLTGTVSWHHEDALAQLDNATRDTLRDHGLWTTRGLDPDLSAVIDVLVQPQREYYGWLTTENDEDVPRSGTLLAVARARKAALFTRDVDREVVAVTSVRPEELFDQFMDHIPARPRATGASITYPAGSTPTNRNDATRLSTILTTPRTGDGSLYAAIRTSAGVRKRIAYPLSYLDTADGRWLKQKTNNRGEEWIVMAPATNQTLGARLREQTARLG